MVRTTNWDDELREAARNGDLIKVQTALENGANPNAKDNNGLTPLHIAARNGHVEIVKLLLEHGANPNTKNDYGWTPLHYASYRGHVEIVKLLLERSANPNTKDNNGWTPLHIAAHKGDVEIVKLLLERSANPNTKIDNISTLIYIVTQGENAFDVAKVLLERGINIGSTPLHIAAYKGHVEIVKILLERGANPRIADNEGYIPLNHAKDSAIRSLLESAMRNSYSEVQGNEGTRVYK